MGAVADLTKRAQPVVWLDSWEYSARLLANGAAPWLDTAACVAWQRKAQGLLKSDVVALPVVPAIEAWLATYPELRAAMAGARPTRPLKMLLADPDLRAHLVDLALGLRAGVAGTPLALVVPTPRAWVELAYRQANDGEIEVSEDDADSASVYIADFLRAFGEAGIDALLLEETPRFAPRSAAELACYQAVLNVAAHYRWDIGLALTNAAQLTEPVPGYGFVITAEPFEGAPRFWPAPPGTFNGAGVSPPASLLRYARIPADAQPEDVLQRLSALR